MDNINIGKIGENLAALFIIKNGWKIVARNYRSKFDEIDIIVISTDQTLIFCEVKTLVRATEGLFLKPEDNLTAHKKRKISRACQIFAAKYPHLINEDRGWRIDLIAVELDALHEVREIRHYENI